MNYKREMFDRYSFIALKQVLAMPSTHGLTVEQIAIRAADIAELMVVEREKRVAKYNGNNRERPTFPAGKERREGELP